MPLTPGVVVTVTVTVTVAVAVVPTPPAKRIVIVIAIASETVKILWVLVHHKLLPLESPVFAKMVVVMVVVMVVAVREHPVLVVEVRAAAALPHVQPGHCNCSRRRSRRGRRKGFMIISVHTSFRSCHKPNFSSRVVIGTTRLRVRD